MDAVLPKRVWTVRTDPSWCYVVPVGYGFAGQGWKLHVSATPRCALLVLGRCARALVRAGCAFKFAPTLERLGELTRPKADRSGAGKFITVYPQRDADVAELAETLHRATLGLPGQQILSDRQYRPGSLVHLRYGVHAAPPVLSDDGLLLARLVAPDGTVTRDRREAWFAVPDWVADPLPATVRADPPPADAGPDDAGPDDAGPDDGEVRLAGRYRVRAAIQHANKGGVYRAVDDRPADRVVGGRGAGEVIIKQARAHVGATLAGHDAQTLLRAEADALDALHPLGLCPRRIDLFTVGDDLFLVEEALAGETLAEWVIGRVWPGRPLDEALGVREVTRLAVQIVDLLGAVHAAGIRLGDLTPGDLMVCDDGNVRCIDLESAAPFGSAVAPMGTPGYLPPEFGSRLTGHLEPGITGDLYSLGAVLFFLATGVDPVLLDDEPAGARAPRVSRLLELAAADGAAAGLLALAIRGLMADDPAQRWSCERVRTHLTGPAGRAVPEPEALLADLVDYLGAVAVREPDRPPESDPRTVYAGAAGLLAVLSRVDPRSAAVDALLDRIHAQPPAGPVLPVSQKSGGVAGEARAPRRAAAAIRAREVRVRGSGVVVSGPCGCWWLRTIRTCVPRSWPPCARTASPSTRPPTGARPT